MTSVAPQRPAQAPTMGRLARVTLLAPHCRADLVLPAEEPIGVLLPEILTLVGLGPAGSPRGYQLSTLTGRVLDPSVSLRGAGVADGALLRVDPLTETPPAAVLTDLSDELADDLSRRRGRWGEPARQRTATVIVTLAALLATLLAAPHLPAAALTLLGLLLLLAGATVALFGPPALGVATLLAGSAIAMAAVPSWTGSWPGRCALWALGAALAVLVLGVVSGHHRAGAFGSGSLTVLLALWGGLPALGLSALTTATIMAVVSVAALGLLPRLALLTSGLTGLDDRCLTDQAVPRAAAAAAVDAAHRGLAVACGAAASSGALAGWVLTQQGTGWTITLAGLLTLAMLLRVRAYPLTVEVVSLLAAALLVIASLAHWLLQLHPARWEGAVALMLVVALTGLVVLGYRPQPHLRVRARQLADRLEGVAVVALIPVAVGAGGVFSALAHTF